VGVCPLFVFLKAVGHSSLTVSHKDLPIDVQLIAERVAQSFGLDIFDIQLRRESSGWVLRVILDKLPMVDELRTESSLDVITISDCQKVSQDLSAVLDTEIEFEHAYTLEVSSPGLDRPLRHLNDCRRFIGCLAKFVMTHTIDGQSYLAGRIMEVEGQKITLDVGNQIHRIPWSVVSRAQLDVEF